MFKVYNHSLQKTEYVKEIDLNKHWKAYLVPFDSIPEEVIEINNGNATTIIEDTIVSLKEEESVIEEVIAAAPKRGRPKAN